MKKNLFFIMILLLLLFVSGTVNAEFYTWEDDSGVTHITSYPPPQNVISKKVQVRKYQSESSPAHDDENIAKEQKKPDVTIYTKNDCPDCDKAREFLQSQKIDFSEYNMDNDPEAISRRKDIDDADDVPFAIINRNHVYGFSESVYNRALKLFP